MERRKGKTLEEEDEERWGETNGLEGRKGAIGVSAAAAAALTGTEVKGVEEETDTGEDVKYEDGTAGAVVGL